MTTPVEKSTCEHPDCGAEDDHPKFHLMTPTSTGLGWQTFHHDCAALLGHTKAALIVKQTEGVKGAELRKRLTDPKHPVHQTVIAHTESETKETK